MSPIEENIREWLKGADKVSASIGSPVLVSQSEFDILYVEGEEVVFQIGAIAILSFIPEDGAVFLSINDNPESGHAVAVLTTVFERTPETEAYKVMMLGLPFVVEDGAVQFIQN